MMRKFTTLLLTISLLLAPAASSFASTGGIFSDTMNAVVEQSSILLQLKEKLAQIQYRYTLLKENLDGAQKNLKETDAAILGMQEVLANLDAQLKDTGRQKLNVKAQKESKKMAMENLEKDAEGLAEQLESQKAVVASLSALLYVKRDVYYNGSTVDPVKVLASPNSVSETLQKMTYLKLVEAQNRDEMAKVTELSGELSEKWAAIRVKQGELDSLDGKIAQDLMDLQRERAHQQELLDETVSEKNILEAMLATTGTTEGDLESQIRIYQSNIEMIERGLVEQGGLLSEEQKLTVAQIQADMAVGTSPEDASKILKLEWPVPLSLGISAFFHDGGYQAEFGVDHYALDVKAKQGSEIFAPADGVVQNVVFDPNSTRYAYVMIAHRMGVVTVYGHISAPAVAIGDYVTRGQLVAYSGGAPRSIGSGVRTTGSHLHFEVWQDGTRVDPLQYLPLDQIPMKNMPAEVLKQIQNALESQIKNF